MNPRSPRSLAVAIAASLAATFHVSATTEDTFRRTLSVQPGGTLILEIPFGSIEIIGTQENRVVLEARRRVRAKSEAAEKTFLTNRPVSVTQSGDTVTIRSAHPTAKLGAWNASMKEVSGKYIVRVPTSFSVQLNTAGGQIGITDLSGNVRAMTSGGGLTFARVTGPIEGKTSGGHIGMQECRGELNVQTSGGSIEVTNGGGSLKANTAGGGIQVRDFGGAAQIKTSGGDLKIENVGGPVTGLSSGGSIHATLPNPVPGAVRLETSGGGITLSAPAQAAFELDAAASGGGCSTETALTRQTSNPKDRSVLRGAFGEGGPTVSLKTSGGSVRIRRSDGVR